MENQRIDKTKKSKLSEFNLEEIRGWIIDRMYQIETKIDESDNLIENTKKMGAYIEKRIDENIAKH